MADGLPVRTGSPHFDVVACYTRRMVSLAALLRFLLTAQPNNPVLAGWLAHNVLALVLPCLPEKVPTRFWRISINCKYTLRNIKLLLFLGVTKYGCTCVAAWCFWHAI